MDIRSYYKAQGLSDEDVETLVANEKVNAVVAKLAGDAENGKTALLKAEEIQNSLKEWNQTQVVPYVQKADMRVAEIESKLSAQATYLKTLKEQGYDVPDTFLGTGAAEPKSSPAALPAAARDYSDDIYASARANMELIGLSNKYRSLTGNELDPAAEYDDFGKSKRPGETLRTYIDRKYDLAGIAARKDEEKKKAYEDGIRKEAAAAALADYQKTHGSNPETRNPKASRFDKIKAERSAEGDGNKLWQTEAGRRQATNIRLEKYRNTSVN